MALCRSCSNRQRAKLDMVRGSDRHYAAQQIRRIVLCRWPSCRSSFLASTPEPCAAMVLGGRCHCHAYRAAEFPLAAALELPVCAIGKRRQGKWARCDARASAVPGAASANAGVCIVGSGAVGIVVFHFFSGPALWGSFLGLPKRVGVHAFTEGQVLLRRTDLPCRVCRWRGVL